MRWQILILALLLGCTTPRDQGVELSRAQVSEGPNIRYLGVGGWLLQWKDEGLLFAPSFTNPPFYRLPFNTTADPARIDELMPEAPRTSMILVGHGHYDHLLDVSHIAQKQAPLATIYGSENVKHMLASTPAGSRVQTVEKELSADWVHPGGWITSKPGHIRIMPIRSEHAPHFAGWHLVPEGSYTLDRDHLPRSAWTWKGGQAIAWLVDLLNDEGKPVFRIHYQDSAANPPFGFPPVLADGKSIDLQILCAGSWTQVDNYPTRLLQVTRPRLIAIGHWENFIGGDLKNPTIIPFLDLKGLVKAAEEAAPNTETLVPAPFSDIPLNLNPS
ncbi:MBL fold metallo-hydrolase [Pseudomonas sp. Marseille-P9899]|uniref:MBL fold metallo-hydrolase n=1 Tax=Pseudomonas sp. Marseille-P9899 TaxID=2730401 RepID=UPI00158EFC62|nr:MBL fold metallo-hydrolase [Pseudomonas sp. Marseille-P9899]